MPSGRLTLDPNETLAALPTTAACVYAQASAAVRREPRSKGPVAIPSFRNTPIAQ